ncbi:uncharacterized protein LOC122519988 [Polistes fuscatus]|uniref:uncharacterized protein LOC122519988 n=1 Tax=Polistes fuscatus TaxID=30207 RepID=UPI001CA98BB1|nr:uncharacterized protein LOC122519988 [Polistes fuscatus]
MGDKESATRLAIKVTMRDNLLDSAPRLTPTGKISHAKTRVYTQRYRKDWEQMPDFKGWLTSVSNQPTRAFCLYCHKNLHAHRLSLLKHTCTMKHQRAASAHHEEKQKKMKDKKCVTMVDIKVEDSNVVETLESTQVETEENEDDNEYIVERLDDVDDDVELNEVQDKQEEEEEIEYADVEEDEHVHIPSDEEDIKHVNKKVKLEYVDDFQENSRDTLAEAMAHVHGEYLDEVDDQENIQMEMIVESEDQNVEIPEIANFSKTVDNNKKMKEDRENNRSVLRKPKHEKRAGLKLSQEDTKSQTDSGLVMTCPLPLLGTTTYQINSSAAGTPTTIGVLQPVNTLPIAPTQNKTITVTSGGKKVTLTGGPFQPGAQYILSKLDGKLSSLIMTEKTSISATKQANKSLQINKETQEQSVIASTSQSLPKNHVILKPVQLATKKPRVSTYVIDTSKGVPVVGLQVSLYKLLDGRWTFLTESNTGTDGRCANLLEKAKVNFTTGRYKIHFDIDKYFTFRKIETIYPFIEIVFDVKNPIGHYHIPVLLSPFGYSTYRDTDS